MYITLTLIREIYKNIIYQATIKWSLHSVSVTTPSYFISVSLYLMRTSIARNLINKASIGVFAFVSNSSNINLLNIIFAKFIFI